MEPSHIHESLFACSPCPSQSCKSLLPFPAPGWWIWGGEWDVDREESLSVCFSSSFVISKLGTFIKSIHFVAFLEIAQCGVENALFSFLKWQSARKFVVVTLGSILMNSFEWWSSNSLGNRDGIKILWFVRLKFTTYGKQIWRDKVFKGFCSYLWRTLFYFSFGNAGWELKRGPG